MVQKQKVLVIVGPTASGKSALAVRLAKKLKGEVISADSRQVYRGLNVGTGKITNREMAGIKHHLLDISAATKRFTASDFLRFGQKAILDIEKRNKLPIICGGTGFYIDVLLGRIALTDVAPDSALRKRLKDKSADELYKLLLKADSKRAKAMNNSDKNNSVRLIRALEIASEPKAMMPLQRDFDVLWLGIVPKPEILRKKIHKRLLQRMKTGMIKEAERLHKKGLSWKRMEELGLEYRYLALFLLKRLTKDVMLKELETKIWQYSKRQMTYWRRNKDIQWFPTAEEAYRAIASGR